MKNRWLNFFKKWHKWPALAFSLFFLAWAVSGIVLNHRQLFSGLDVGRNLLPKEYRYQNWNNAALKGSLAIGKDSLLVYGNLGVWLTDQRLSGFRDFNQGFPAGTDNRKIFCMLRSSDGPLYAGTLFGLFYREKAGREWEKVPLPVKNERIVSLLEKDGRILVMTRSELFEIQGDPGQAEPARISLRHPVGYDNQEGVFRTFWVIHSGEIWGMAGRLIVDLAGLVLILLTLTGLIHFVAPYILRRRKKKKRPLDKVSRWKRTSIRWHKVTGIWIALLLLINVITGMFLRPPLLIPIADATMKKIPWSVLDSDNAWEDKLRDFSWDEHLGGYLISTSTGFYLADGAFEKELAPIYGQPPVSVMGINAFIPEGDGTYLVGSFSGLFLWSPSSGQSVDYFTGARPQEGSTRGRPIGEKMVAGYVRLEDGREWYLDYNLGALPVRHHTAFPEMPGEVVESGKMSWWNLALEFHTARTYKVFMGDFYILLIPLLGLSGVVLITTGSIVWWKLYRRRKACK